MRARFTLLFCVLPLLIGGWMVDPKHYSIDVRDPTNWQSTNLNLGRRCIGESKVIYGEIRGYDGHAVNALIGMDLIGPDGSTPVDGGGCAGRERAKGYGVTVRVNYLLGAQGTKVRAGDSRLKWSAVIPATVSKAYFEVYPKSSVRSPRYGNTVHTHYGNAMRPTIDIGPRGGVVSQILLPSVRCGALSTGTLSGRFFHHGRLVNGIYASAFSETGASGTPRGRGPFGFSVWRAPRGNHSFELPALASGYGRGQAYTVFGRLADGTSKQFYMARGDSQIAGIRACTRTYLDLHF